MANLDVFEREDICGHVRRKEGELRGMLDSLRDIPIVGDVRGAGFFHAIELVKDQETKEGFTDEESEWLLRGFLSGELFRRGLICRADDRGDPVIQLAPTLICDTEQFEEIENVLRPVLTEAWERIEGTPAADRVRFRSAPRARLMLTVGSLVGDCGLELGAGADGADRPIRWVHISELEDPTPWLSGGELLLTTGIQLKGAARQRRFLARLAERDVAGLGLGTGFEHKRLPKALVDEAEERGIPVFEVPYEMPFIAITERAFARLVNEQYAVLERGTQVHERLERLVIEGRGLEAILGSIASAVGGSAIVQDAGGRELARQPIKGGPGAAALKALGAEAASRRATSALTPFEPQHESLSGRALAVPVPGRRGGAPVAWLIVVSQRGPLGDLRAPDRPAGLDGRRAGADEGTGGS